MVLDEINSKWHSALKCMAVLARPISFEDLQILFQNLPQYSYNDAYILYKEMRNLPILKQMSDSPFYPTYIFQPKAFCDILKLISETEFNKICATQKYLDDYKRVYLSFSRTLHDFLTNREVDYNILNSGLIILLSADHIVYYLEYLESNDTYFPFLINMPAGVLRDMFCKRSGYLDSFEKEPDNTNLNELYLNNKTLDVTTRNQYADKLTFYKYCVYAADMQQCEKKIHKDTFYGYIFSAFQLQYAGKYAEAIKMYKCALKNNNAKVFTDLYVAFMYIQAIISDSSTPCFKPLSTLYKKYRAMRSVRFDSLKLLILSELNDNPGGITTSYMPPESSNIEKILMAFTVHHYGLLYKNAQWINKINNEVAESDYRLLQIEFAQEFKSSKKYDEDELNKCGWKATIKKYKKPESWELVIDKLMSLNEGVSNQSSKEERTRIVYVVDGGLDITPKLQKSKDGVIWSKGRNIAISKFKNGIPEMSELDKRMMSQVKVKFRSWNGAVDYGIFGPSAIATLMGSPLVFMAENPNLRIDILAEKPQLIVKKKGDYFVVSNNLESGTGRIIVKKETPQLFKVIRLSNRQIEIFSSLNEVRKFPLVSEDRLTTLLEKISGDVTILSELMKNSDNLKQKKGSSLITVQMRPISDEITVMLFVKPLAEGALYCNPGTGMDYIATNVKGIPVQVKRNLEKEKENLERVMTVMDSYDDCQDNNRWTLSAPDCLQLLDSLKDMSDYCCVEWPEGARFKIASSSLNPSNFSFSVKGIGQWFEIDGQVKISDGTVMKMSELLNRYHEREGNFIRLGNKEYAELSSSIRKQLSVLDRLLEKENGKMRLSAFNVGALEDIQEAGADLQVDETYQNLIHRIEESENKEYAVPGNLQADLREYQKEGYQWMAKIAGWGGGACLADDMGLGKTLQAIALMLERGKKGASLVIVPTSLLLNWQDEINKFAPTLTPLILNDAGENRQKLIAEANDYDVVITTYGLLVSEEDMICSHNWNMIVLDEAHTIKNRETKMSKAAMKLKADFRLMLTGTPLQNHLSEIWNLFQFADPGLLGSFKHFTDRFIIPIEKDHNKEQQRLLNRILSSFILRRTKSEVLSELPEKTEVTMKVEMSDEEWGVYEHIRKQALLNLEEESNSTMKTLAEITKLRQAACNPALINASLKINSSKMEMLMGLVEDLINNHHRALVFSQFTSHLDLIKKSLDKKGISYLYLDGQVTAQKRVELVKEYQTGDVPLFLISLKAGGLGLNLTAADYIIHMDPWWNPAIEDQASDRAYRIGQKRPVTVYRLISKGTIEEKIIELHQTKKNLADALLDGSDMSQKMTREELLSLLNNQI